MTIFLYKQVKIHFHDASGECNCPPQNPWNKNTEMRFSDLIRLLPLSLVSSFDPTLSTSETCVHLRPPASPVPALGGDRLLATGSVRNGRLGR